MPNCQANSAYDPDFGQAKNLLRVLSGVISIDL